jgi:Putative amidoligase enzyme
MAFNLNSFTHGAENGKYVPMSSEVFSTVEAITRRVFGAPHSVDTIGSCAVRHTINAAELALRGVAAGYETMDVSSAFVNTSRQYTNRLCAADYAGFLDYKWHPVSCYSHANSPDVNSAEDLAHAKFVYWASRVMLNIPRAVVAAVRFMRWARTDAAKIYRNSHTSPIAALTAQRMDATAETIEGYFHSAFEHEPPEFMFAFGLALHIHRDELLSSWEHMAFPEAQPREQRYDRTRSENAARDFVVMFKLAETRRIMNADASGDLQAHGLTEITALLLAAAFLGHGTTIVGSANAYLRRIIMLTTSSRYDLLETEAHGLTYAYLNGGVRKATIVSAGLQWCPHRRRVIANALQLTSPLLWADTCPVSVADGASSHPLNAALVVVAELRYIPVTRDSPRGLFVHTSVVALQTNRLDGGPPALVEIDFSSSVYGRKRGGLSNASRDLNRPHISVGWGANRTPIIAQALMWSHYVRDVAAGWVTNPSQPVNYGGMFTRWALLPADTAYFFGRTAATNNTPRRDAPRPQPAQIQSEVGGYHSSKAHIKKHPHGEGPLMGYEWEIAQDEVIQDTRFGPSVDHVIQLAYAAHCMADNYIFVERDGSLRDRGVELVSSPARLGVHKRMLDRLQEQVPELLSGLEYQSVCGTHVHVEKAWFSNDQEKAAFVLFWNFGWKMPSMMHDTVMNPATLEGVRLSRTSQLLRARLDSGYAQPFIISLLRKAYALSPKGNGSTKGKDAVAVYKYLVDHMSYARGSSRYAAVNVMNRATLEIRLFDGTVSTAELARTLTWVAASAEYIKALGISEASPLAWRKMGIRGLASYVMADKARYPDIQQEAQQIAVMYAVNPTDKVNNVNKGSGAHKLHMDTVVAAFTPTTYTYETHTPYIMLGTHDAPVCAPDETREQLHARINVLIHDASTPDVPPANETPTEYMVRIGSAAQQAFREASTPGTAGTTVTSVIVDDIPL